jgi:bla regulator protein BlaR1
MIIRESGCVAFVIGVRSPVVVLSTGLVTKLGDHEVEGILAHELGHVRRLDHLGRWIATVFRDIMAWNPFVLLWYNRLVAEQETACDEYAAALLGDPVAVANALVELAAFPQQGRLRRTAGVTAWRGGGRGSAERLNQRLDRLAEAVHGTVRPSRWRMLALVVLLAAFVAAQPYAAVSLPNIGEVLTRLF